MKNRIIILSLMIFLIEIVISAPLVTIDSPVDTGIYVVDWVDLNWSVNESSDWCAYSFDNGGNDTSIHTPYTWENWNTNSSILSGLGSPDVISTLTTFYKDGTWYLINGDNQGDFTGYNWTGTSWQSDTGITNGLVDMGEKSSPHVFEKDGTFYLITGNNSLLIYGYNWTGTSWQVDNGIVSGLGSSCGWQRKTSVFEKEGTLFLIQGNSGGGFCGFNWTGTSWQSDVSIINGLVSAPAYSSSSVFYADGTLYLIKADNKKFLGYNWTGTIWQNDTAIVTGLYSGGDYNYPYPSVFNFSDTEFYLISGEYSGLFRGFDKTFQPEQFFNTTITSISDGEHNVTLFCNNSLGNYGQAFSSFDVNTSVPNITIISPKNITYNTEEVALAVQSYDYVDTWWYSRNGGKINITFVPNIYLIADEGSNQVFVYANNSIGNIASKNVTFMYSLVVEVEEVEIPAIYLSVGESLSKFNLFLLYFIKILPIIFFPVLIVLSVIAVGYGIALLIKMKTSRR